MLKVIYKLSGSAFCRAIVPPTDYDFNDSALECEGYRRASYNQIRYISFQIDRTLRLEDLDERHTYKADRLETMWALERIYKGMPEATFYNQW